VTVGSDLTNDRGAAVDTDAHTRPIRVLLRQLSELALQRQRCTCSAEGMVRLVTSAVEGRHDAVTYELLHFAAELTGDQRCGDAPVRVAR
jgi:hypothetical protein